MTAEFIDFAGRTLCMASGGGTGQMCKYCITVILSMEFPCWVWLYLQPWISILHHLHEKNVALVSILATKRKNEVSMTCP